MMNEVGSEYDVMTFMLSVANAYADMASPYAVGSHCSTMAARTALLVHS